MRLEKLLPKFIISWLSIALIVCGIGASILGWYSTNQVVDASNQAMWWNGKIHMRRVALLSPENSKYTVQPTPVDIAEAEHQVNDFLSKSSYFSALCSRFFGLSGIMIGVGAILISIAGSPNLNRLHN